MPTPQLVGEPLRRLEILPGPIDPLTGRVGTGRRHVSCQPEEHGLGGAQASAQLVEKLGAGASELWRAPVWHLGTRDHVIIVVALPGGVTGLSGPAREAPFGAVVLRPPGRRLSQLSSVCPPLPRNVPGRVV